jgi:two-component system chemotaxis response regulator CheY
MKTLIVEDDFASRVLLQALLKNHGPSHIAINGKEAVEAVRAAAEAGEPYDLVCLDIMMPEMDGQEALKEIRRMEEAKGIAFDDGVKIIMITAKQSVKDVTTARANGYLVKPITPDLFEAELHKRGLIA